MWNDIAFALRSFRRTPLFAIIAIFTLALGVSANTSIFSLFYQVLLKTLPVRSPEQLVVLHSPGPSFPGWVTSDNGETVFSYPMYTKLRDGAKSFNGLAARSSLTVQIAQPNGTDRASAEVVSGNFFDVLGIRPSLGRLLTIEDDRIRGGSPVAVLTHSYWRDHFGGSSGVLNRKILLNGHPFLVVGVAQAGFEGFLTGESRALFLPISMKEQVAAGWTGTDDVSTQWLNIVGRLKPGVMRETGLSNLQPVWLSAIREELPRMRVRGEAGQRRVLAKTLSLRSASAGINGMESHWRSPLTALLAMVGLLLIIACANLANLLIARAVGRAREIAVRLAIGASRWQIVRQMLAESLLLSVSGGLLGLAMSVGMVRGLIAVLPTDMAEHWLTASPDWVVLGFSLAMVVVTTALFGLLPALQSMRVDAMPALKDQSATVSASGTHTHWRQALVVGQLAISLCLLVGAILFARTVTNLMSHDPGFTPAQLLTFSVDPDLSGYTLERGRTFYRGLLQNLTRVAGVESVSLAQASPLSGEDRSTNVTVDGFEAQNDDDADSNRNDVGPGYFRTLGTPLIAGREFEEQDREGAAKVVLVNQAFARHFLRGKNPVGRRMAVGGGGPLDLEIVGVVKDSQNDDLREIPKPFYYLPLEQTYGKKGPLGSATFFVRSQGDLPALERAVRLIVRNLDANVPVYDVGTMTAKMDKSAYTDRLIATLASAFGLLALLLAAVGLYGVVAYSVARRTNEIGIRLALGALPNQVLQLVMREVVGLALGGVAIGLPGAYWLSRLVSSQLYGIESSDTFAFLSSTVLLLVVMLAAGIIPALRAARLDPKNALRYE